MVGSPEQRLALDLVIPVAVFATLADFCLGNLAMFLYALKCTVVIASCL